MNEIINKTFELIDVLEESSLIKELSYYKNIIMKDTYILDKVKKINDSKYDYEITKLKKELYQNDNYKKYMEKYNELYLITLKINNKYNSYLTERGCNI